jgi:hypothetical protein
MNRRTFIAAASAFALQPSLPAQSPGLDSVRASVYTYILSQRCAETRETLAVEETPWEPTAPILMEKMLPPIKAARFIQDGSSILSPPPDRMQDAQALIDDYKRKLWPPYRIPSGLKLPRPYRLVTALEREQFFLLQTDGPARNALPAKLKREFEHISWIHSLSPVALHPQLPLALAFCSAKSVGSLKTWLYILERSGDTWSPLPWPTSTRSFEETGSFTSS